jgi:hypothetical protein
MLKLLETPHCYHLVIIKTAIGMQFFAANRGFGSNPDFCFLRLDFP